MDNIQEQKRYTEKYQEILRSLQKEKQSLLLDQSAIVGKTDALDFPDPNQSLKLYALNTRSLYLKRDETPYVLFRYNRVLMLQAIAISADNIVFSDKSLWNDRTFILEAVQANPRTLQYAHRFRSDQEIVETAISRNPDCLTYADKTLQDNFAFILQMVKKCPLLLKYVSPAFKSNAQIVSAAVSKDPYMLEHATLPLNELGKLDEKDAKDAKDVLRSVRLWLLEDIRKDNWLLEDIRKDKTKLSDIPNIFKNDGFFLVEALNGNMEIWADMTHKQKKLAATYADFANPRLCNHADFMRESVRCDPTNFQHVGSCLKEDEKFMLTMTHYSQLHKQIDEKWKNNPEFMLKVIKMGQARFPLIGKELKKDMDFMLKAICANPGIILYHAKDLHHFLEDITFCKAVICRSEKNRFLVLDYWFRKKPSENPLHNSEFIQWLRKEQLSGLIQLQYIAPGAYRFHTDQDILRFLQDCQDDEELSLENKQTLSCIASFIPQNSFEKTAFILQAIQISPTFYAFADAQLKKNTEVKKAYCISAASHDVHKPWDGKLITLHMGPLYEKRMLFFIKKKWSSHTKETDNRLQEARTHIQGKGAKIFSKNNVKGGQPKNSNFTIELTLSKEECQSLLKPPHMSTRSPPPRDEIEDSKNLSELLKAIKQTGYQKLFDNIAKISHNGKSVWLSEAAKKRAQKKSFRAVCFDPKRIHQIDPEFRDDVDFMYALIERLYPRIQITHASERLQQDTRFQKRVHNAINLEQKKPLKKLEEEMKNNGEEEEEEALPSRRKGP